MENRTRLLILDRDGTVIQDRHYLDTPDGVELLPGAAAGIRHFQRKGFTPVIVTNQSGVARGYFTMKEVNSIHIRLEKLLREEEVEIAHFYVCPHGPGDACRCRKPETGMAQDAAQDYHAELNEAVVIGDKPADLQLAHAIGAKAILVRSGYGAETEKEGIGDPDLVADSIEEAALLYFKA